MKANLVFNQKKKGWPPHSDYQNPKWARLVDLPSVLETVAGSLAPHKPGVVGHAYNPSTWEIILG